jgi:hypothetical protein
MWIKATQDIILLEDVGLATGSLDTLLLSLGQLEDVAVHRILKVVDVSIFRPAGLSE